MAYLTPHNLIAWTGGSVAYGSLQECVSVYTDSRHPVPGGLFVALTGENFDGHQFVGAAQNAGAMGAVIDHNHVGVVQAKIKHNQQPFFLLSVENTLTALHDLARGTRLQFKGPVIAITGSNGKTSTKEITAACLGTQAKVLATQKNYNNEVGLPLTLLGLTPEHDACVVEVAMRAIGQIAQLSATALPDVAVVTNVGPVHLATLGSIANVALAKSELVQALSPAGTAVLNADDPRVVRMRDVTSGKVITYGITSESINVKAHNITKSAQGSDFDLYVDGQFFQRIRLVLPGLHNVYNALAALAATMASGFDLAVAADALAQLSPAPMRLEFSTLPHDVTIVNDAYNASPLSMRAALEVLASTRAQRKVAVLGDMLELGNEHDVQHRSVGRLAAEAGVERLVTVGEGGLLIAAGAQAGGIPVDSCTSYPNAVAAANDAQQWIQPGDLILVKASRGMRLEQVVEAIKATLTAGTER